MRGQFYAQIMSKVRVAVVSRMRKPKEILIVEDENGELVRETLPDSANIEMYKQMRLVWEDGREGEGRV